MDIINFVPYERIINGDLQPDLAKFSNERQLKKYHDDIIQFYQNSGFPLKDDKTDLSIIDDFDFRDAPPKGLKSDFFILLIKKISRDNEDRINQYFESGGDIKYISVIANKEILLLKKLSIKTHIYHKRISGGLIDNISDPNVYVIHVLKAYLVRLIGYMQYIFKDIVSTPPQTKDKLIIELFENGFLLGENSNKLVGVPQKLKTKLSVPQLAYLFKLLYELKPDIFDVNSKAELHRFISANFSTKATANQDISTEKLKQLFSGPDPDSANFWLKHFSTMLSETKKYN